MPKSYHQDSATIAAAARCSSAHEVALDRILLQLGVNNCNSTFLTIGEAGLSIHRTQYHFKASKFRA